MATSIYSLVRQKLIRHGADKSRDGRIIIENKRVFLAFVRLERGIRATDFEAVRAAVVEIERCASSVDKRHLVIFAYMYLFFSDGTPACAKEALNEDGSVLMSLEYKRPVTAEERLIADWGKLMYNRLGADLLRHVYLSNHDRALRDADLSSPS